VWVPALLAALAGPLRAAGPPDELLRLVPDDIGFCVVLRDLRGHSAALLDSPFVGQLRHSPVGAALLGSREAEKLARVGQHLEKHLGLGWARLRDDILGDAVVFAYRPGPPGKPEQEQGLILVRARNARALADLIDGLNRAQRQAGELKGLQERDYHGVRYHRREERKRVNRVERTEVNYYYLCGPVLVFSGQEAMLRQAIDRGRAADAGAEPALARRLRELGADRALVSVWVNPRAFDADLEARIARAGPATAPGLQTFAVYWKALEGVALLAALDRDLSLSLAVRARTEQLPAAARRFLAEASRPSELWRSFPDNALLAVAGRVDLSALSEALGDFLPRESRAALRGQVERTLDAALGRSFVKEVLPALGPDWGLCLTAPAAPDKGWLPQAVLALRVAPGEAESPVDQALLSALHFWATVAVLGHNKQNPDRPMSLKTAFQDKREVKYVASEQGLPPGVQPAFGLRHGYLVLASSPDVLRRFSPPAAPGGPAPAGPVPWLRASFKDWRAYVAERRDALAEALAAKQALTREEAGRRLDKLLDGLRLLDRLEVRQRTAPGQVTFTLTVRTALPLKK
jgi:hypothetical protein